MNLGDTITSLRNERGLDQYDLARISGIGLSLLQAYEHGRKVPTLGNLMRLARALGAQLGHFDGVVIPTDRRHRDRRILSGTE
jgi:transcriptional regulator with XRE-family HTH domain